MTTNEDLMKSLATAVDVAMAELLAVSNLSKAEVSLQDAKIGEPNGDLAGKKMDSENTIKPEGAKKSDDWVVHHITDLFHTTHKVKTQQVDRSRGQ